jgi:hypothetical protein
MRAEGVRRRAADATPDLSLSLSLSLARARSDTRDENRDYTRASGLARR